MTTSIKILECVGEHVRVKREIIIPPIGVEFDNTIGSLGDVDDAIAELVHDAPLAVEMNRMGYPGSVTKLFIRYPANLDGVELEKFKTKIQSVCGSANLEFIKSEWIHTKRGWFKQP